MKTVIGIAFLIGSLVTFAACWFILGPVVDRELPIETGEVISDLKNFLATGVEETIELDRSKVADLLHAFGPEQLETSASSVMKDSTIKLDFGEPVTAHSSGISTDKFGSSRDDIVEGAVRNDLSKTIPQSIALPVAKAGLASTAGAHTSTVPSATAPAPPATASAPPATASAPPATASAPPATASAPPATAPEPATAPATIAPPPPQHSAEEESTVPEGFHAELTEPTIGAKFVWDRTKKWWRSDEFDKYLKGSDAQNDSFCWLLTTNSQGAGTSDIPEGWTFQALGNGRSIVIAQKGRDLTSHSEVRSNPSGNSDSKPPIQSNPPAVPETPHESQESTVAKTKGSMTTVPSEKDQGDAYKPADENKEGTREAGTETARMSETPDTLGVNSVKSAASASKPVVSSGPAVENPTPEENGNPANPNEVPQSPIHHTEEGPNIPTPIPKVTTIYLPLGTPLPGGGIPYARPDPGWSRLPQPNTSPDEIPRAQLISPDNSGQRENQSPVNEMEESAKSPGQKVKRIFRELLRN